MNNLTHKTIFFLVILTLNNLNFAQIKYHSEADLPYSNKTTRTYFEVIVDDNGENPFDFGIIFAKDNDVLSYILISAVKSARMGAELEDYNLANSVPITRKRAEEFINILEKSAEKWNDRFDKRTAINFEFLIAPEHKIIPQSLNVDVWYSTLAYYFQNDNEGAKAYLIIGNDKLKYEYKIEEYEKLKVLINLLKKAVSK